jgi:hypothetical protein
MSSLVAQVTLIAAISANSQNILIDGRTIVRLESVRCGQFEVTAMVSTLLSIAFGAAGFLVLYFGIGSAWEFSLGVAVVTAVGLWLGDRSTTNRVAPKGTPTVLTTQHLTTRARRRIFIWLSRHVFPRSHTRA